MNYEIQSPVKRDHHYGWVELRALMDFIYNKPPQTEIEKLHSEFPYKGPH